MSEQTLEIDWTSKAIQKLKQSIDLVLHRQYFAILDRRGNRCVKSWWRVHCTKTFLLVFDAPRCMSNLRGDSSSSHRKWAVWSCKGAFTGRRSRSPRQIFLADGGTLFLDEIGELPLRSTRVLLRAIQNKNPKRWVKTKFAQRWCAIHCGH